MNRLESSATVRAAVTVGSAVVAVAAVMADVGAPAQPILVLWFVLVCPGAAFVGLVRLPSPGFAFALSVATSCALAAVVAQVMLFAGVWSPLGGLVVLAELTIVAAVAGLAVDLRASRLTAAPGRGERR
ncbi:hypothetical protein [Nocardioides xinjiangensis]|uniref:hypothetical protein n=1 Tax=Nocardioides xinjiangensis TaxID=2817376 RepID=UPI001B310A59|nr:MULTISPECIES: hypothetical protein [unclassified Nocardioides]